MYNIQIVGVTGLNAEGLLPGGWAAGINGLSDYCNSYDRIRIYKCMLCWLVFPIINLTGTQTAEKEGA